MDILEFLSGPARMKEEINHRIDELNSLYTLSTSISSPTFGKVGSSGSKTPDANFTNIVNKIVDKESELQDAVDELFSVSAEVTEAIKSLSDKRYRDVLSYRFILGYSPGAAAHKLNYSIRHIERLYAAAIEEIKHVIE